MRLPQLDRGARASPTTRVSGSPKPRHGPPLADPRGGPTPCQVRRAHLGVTQGRCLSLGVDLPGRSARPGRKGSPQPPRSERGAQRAGVRLMPDLVDTIREIDERLDELRPLAGEASDLQALHALNSVPAPPVAMAVVGRRSGPRASLQRSRSPRGDVKALVIEFTMRRGCVHLTRPPKPDTQPQPVLVANDPGRLHLRRRRGDQRDELRRGHPALGSTAAKTMAGWLSKGPLEILYVARTAQQILLKPLCIVATARVRPHQIRVGPRMPETA